MARRQFWEQEWHFFELESPWAVVDTSAAGAPTKQIVTSTPTGPGEYQMVMANDNEVENLCLTHGGALNFLIGQILGVEFRVKMEQASLDSASSLAVGLASARNDAIDSIDYQALFRLIGSNTLVVESDDGVHNNDDVATVHELVNVYKTLSILFTAGTSDVRFFVDGEPAGDRTTFDMSSYTGGLQPYLQIQKTADTNTDGVRIDYCRIWGKY